MDTLASLVARAHRLAVPGSRRILGITGPPGAGKSTLAGALTAALGGHAVYVPMDGFHLAQAELERLGRAGRKGAPDTFDAAGYRALLMRLAEPADGVVYAPTFDRGLEEPIAGAIGIGPDIPLVVTEGNYLLSDGVWSGTAQLLDQSWYLELPEDVRQERLLARHRRYGRSPEAARFWAEGSDRDNALLVARTRHRADRVVRWTGSDYPGTALEDRTTSSGSSS